ncbi:YqcC family protein [Brenneria izbisi]|uniref:YqcC family protein n=1 Tax=Brenneria izbisi TaxID=2939450 RepID=A0AA42C5D8_9GAMM|nr:YqcC family protein [Brenneria izbisi]MCV9879174.1 YqcC family protein [Brenneria izbisi]MCV9882792.1 YqcC family protein [Brenneria izbisi]
MSIENQVRQALFDLERALRDSPFWELSPPQTAAFNSVEPFCVDTMPAAQWLQWVLLPRMHALLDSAAPLPEKFSLLPYFEEALDGAPEEVEPVLRYIGQLDALFIQHAQDGFDMDDDETPRADENRNA